MTSNKRIKKMAGVAILTAVAVVLQLIANYITIGTVSINLSLIPIAICAIVYGPISGTLIGAIVGAIIISAPSTGGFLSINPIATVFLCLLKTGLAGTISGLLFKLIKKWNFNVAIIISSLIVPIINTSIFLLGSWIWFLPVFNNDGMVLVTSVLTINFLIEIIITSVLSPTLIYLIKILDKRHNLNLQ